MDSISSIWKTPKGLTALLIPLFIFDTKMGSLLPYKPSPDTSTREKLRGFGRYGVRYTVISCEIILLNLVNLVYSASFSVGSAVLGNGVLYLVLYRPFRMPSLWSIAECTLVGSLTIDVFIMFACICYNKARFGHWMGWEYFPGGDFSKKAVKEPNIDFSPPKRHGPPPMFILPHPTWVTVLTFVRLAVLNSLGTAVLSYFHGK